MTVNTAPTIISQPQSATVCPGGLVTFGVNFSGPPSAYQWRLNGNIVHGANSPMFTNPSAQQSDEGNYTLDYTTSCGVLTSQTAFLDVQVTPSFIQQPVGATICEGQALNLSVQTQGDADYYQWCINSSPIVGATSSSYTLPSATSAQAGTYTVIAGNNVCNNSALSQDAVVQVNTAPIFSQQPVGGTYCQGDVVTLSPQFANNVTNFEWLYLGSPVPGGNGSVLTLNNIQPTQAGTYVLYAENQCGGVYSSLANIQVNPSYQQTIQQTICFGDSYTFNGTNLSQSGTYVEQLQTITGCDSITTLVLTVLPENSTILSASICLGDSYTFDGQNLTTSGTYSAYYTAANGCDSLVELSLVVVDPNQVYPTSVSLCPGNSLIWGTQTLTQAGVYQQLFTAVGGCDSLVELTLSYFNLPTVSIANNSGNLSVTGGLSNYQWYVNGVAINGATSETHVATQRMKLSCRF
ncbi:MAG: immunoglobulin domain-containing protein [Crocinitomicaceae bacterium]